MRKVLSTRYSIFIMVGGLLVSGGNYAFQIFARFKLIEPDFVALVGFSTILSVCGIALGGLKTFVVAQTSNDELQSKRLENITHSYERSTVSYVSRWVPSALIALTTCTPGLASSFSWHLLVAVCCLVISFVLQGQLLGQYRYLILLLIAGFGVIGKFVVLEFVSSAYAESSTKSSLVITIAMLFAVQVLLLSTNMPQQIYWSVDLKQFPRLAFTSAVVGGIAGLDTIIVAYVSVDATSANYLTMSIFAKSSVMASLALAEFYLPTMNNPALTRVIEQKWLRQTIVLGFVHLFVTVTIFKLVLETRFDIQPQFSVLASMSLLGTVQGVFSFYCTRLSIRGDVRLSIVGAILGVIFTAIYGYVPADLSSLPSALCVVLLIAICVFGRSDTQIDGASDTKCRTQ